MLDAIIQFIIKFKFIIIFYLAAIIFLYIKRKNIETQAKIIFLYRMKWGLRWMDKYSKKFREWIILLGYIGVGIGFIGSITISVVLVKNLFDLIFNPATTPGVSLVLPGINIPGLGILPFWHWLLAIFVIAVVHEFGHGIVARAHNIRVKNTGIVFFGPIIGAFVEPDEKQVRKQKDIKQYSVLAAGAFTNIILAFIALLLLNFAFTPLQESMVESTGFTFDQYVNEDLPFAQAGITTGTIIIGLNELETNTFQQFSSELLHYRPGDEVTIKTAEQDYTLVLAANPEDESKPYMGIQSIHNEFDVKEKFQTSVWNVLYYVVDWFTSFFRWLFILSFGIGLFNLLPLPIVDGGRMMQVFLHKLRGEKKGEKTYKKISLFLLFILLLNLIFPLLMKLF
jgi:membrane-associated protease RseP (regulator of RpoE activity)